MSFSDLIDKSFHLRVGIRNAISKVYIGVGLGEVILKLKLECFPFESIATVSFNKTYIKRVLLGPFLIYWIRLSLLVGFINVRLHSFVVESLRFAHVTDV
jgi:hypothetical protein